MSSSWVDRSRGRALVALLALVFGVADLLGFVHQATERHVVCEEHGELVHVGAAAPALADDGAALLAVDLDADPAHDEDQHCRSCGTTADPQQAPGAHALVRGPAPTPAGPGPARVVADPSPRARHRMAPKTSPPLA